MENVKKLLDNGHLIAMFRNDLGTYTTVAIEKGGPLFDGLCEYVGDLDDFSRRVTDDFEPSKSLDRLTDKMLGLGDYETWPPAESEAPK